MLSILKESREEDNDPYFNEGYFPKQEEILRELTSKYNDY
jgi:hypothetical protein